MPPKAAQNLDAQPAVHWLTLRDRWGDLNPARVAFVVATGLFVGIVVCLEIGYRLGRRSSAKNPELAHEGIGVIEAAVFALLGLLLGFSFAGGTSRLDAKRQLIVQEANAIAPTSAWKNFRSTNSRKCAAYFENIWMHGFACMRNCPI